jgi:hypothetical protein
MGITGIAPTSAPPLRGPYYSGNASGLWHYPTHKRFSNLWIHNSCWLLHKSSTHTVSYNSFIVIEIPMYLHCVFLCNLIMELVSLWACEHPEQWVFFNINLLRQYRYPYSQEKTAPVPWVWSYTGWDSKKRANKYISIQDAGWNSGNHQNFDGFMTLSFFFSWAPPLMLPRFSLLLPIQLL